MCWQSDYYDVFAIQNSYSGSSLIAAFSLNGVEKFLRSLGVEEIAIHKDYLICPTICHNHLDAAESMKLYYYDNTKSFHCYTQCSESFNIIRLYQMYMELNHQRVSVEEAEYYLRQFINITQEPTARVAPEINKFDYDQEIEKKDIITLPEINKNALDFFTPMPHPLWEQEGITKEVQQQFGIRFSYLQNRIIIPHYDINGRLIGIRGRALEEEDIAWGKYAPIRLYDTMYNHQLGFNLYGIWEHKEAIKRTQRAVIYEGEKSCLLDSVYYGPYSVAVATCGSQLNRFQINLLVQELGVSDIILAYDKEYDTPYDIDGKRYRKKLIDKCEKYRGLVNLSYIFDEQGLLNRKDAPCDKGQEILETLMKRRIKIR